VLSGVVTPDLEARVALEVVGEHGQSEQVQATIDTGFDGWLTLPLALVQRLRLPSYGQERGVLADGSERTFDLYLVQVEVGSERRAALVAAAEGGPLVGMSLLTGLRLTIEVIEGGHVQLDPIGGR